MQSEETIIAMESEEKGRTMESEEKESYDQSELELLRKKIKLFGASRMALIPGSYARAAGLQSEINKVTITRVAGSEVQFRRTIDTYQKDLRYHVNQIGREQKQLKRSMRKYSRKLHDSRKEQKQRKAKVREDAERLKQHSQSFKQAEQAVKRSSYVIPKPQAEAPGDGNEQSTVGEGDPASTDHNTESSAQPENGDSVLPVATEGDPEGNSDTVVHPDSAQTVKEGEKAQPKVFLTKSKLPYLRAKQTHTEKSQGNETSHQSDEPPNKESTSTLLKPPEAELSLPMIREEAECGSDCKGDKAQRADILKLSDSSPQTANDSATLSKLPKPSISAHVPTVTITSLNTKSVSKSDEASGGAVGGGSELSGVSLPALYSTAESRGRRGAGKTGVSFGDLIKLQHMPSSSSKKLFKLVDRLAAKHGIKDMPEDSSLSPPSLDPRSNEKLKQSRHNDESQRSDGIVRQAAVLYSMKYGYHGDDDQFFGDTLPPILLSQDTADDFSSHPDTARADSAVAKLHVTSRRSSNANEVHKTLEVDVSDLASRRLSLLSIRREYLEMTSPVSALSEVRWSSSDDRSAEAFLDTHLNHPGQRKTGHVPTMSDLSRQASRMRDRTLLEADLRHASNDLYPNDRTLEPEGTTEPSRQSRSARRMSVLSRHSRPRSRSRRETVNSQLQKRLRSNEYGEGSKANTAWQSAFGRLKLVHTLKDLSQHFQRDGN